MLFSDKKQAAEKRRVLEGGNLFLTKNCVCNYGKGLEGYALSVVTM